MKYHSRPVECQYDGCMETKGSNKDIIRHAWAAHPIWADKMGYKQIDGTCPNCKYYFTRSDNLTQHLREGKCKGKGVTREH